MFMGVKFVLFKIWFQSIMYTGAVWQRSACPETNEICRMVLERSLGVNTVAIIITTSPTLAIWLHTIRALAQNSQWPQRHS